MKKIYTFIVLFQVMGAIAQTDCNSKLAMAKEIIESNTLYKDYNKIFQEISPCAEQGDAIAQNYVGLMYLDGMGVSKDEAKGFSFVEMAAKNNDASAQFNLGNLYRQGKGCSINMVKAVHWFEKAADMNNARAAYSLGYMYLKGFGVKQDYTQAVAWFRKSSFGMAKHWLGVCYYLGYGVPQNTEKALEYLYGNTTPNSKAFLKNLKIEKRDQILKQVDQAIDQAGNDEKKIESSLILDSRELNEDQNALTTKEILGEWTGKFIEYDWSGNQPLRVLPVNITFSKDEHGNLKTKIDFEGKTFDDIALFDNNNLFIDGFHFKFDQLYNHSFNPSQLDYIILGMDLSRKSYNNTTYLLADVDSFIGCWKEPGPPISLVLRPKNDVSISKEEEDLLLALSSQKTDFIKLYPVPFKDQLYVAFELESSAHVKVSVISVATAQTLQISSANLDSGTQSFNVNTTELPNGYYVVQVQENEKVHTRIVIKQ